MALVPYDPVMAQHQLVFGRDPVLLVGGLQLTPYVHTASGRVLLARQGRDVEFVRGSITPAQIGSHRASYINAILIQSRGRAVSQPCEACRRPRTGLRSFPECRRAIGHFGGACANCKWRDHGNRCSLVRVDDEDDDVVITGSRRLEGPSRVNDAENELDAGHDGGVESSARNPLLLE